jgi:hypothetical protein
MFVAVGIFIGGMLAMLFADNLELFIFGLLPSANGAMFSHNFGIST